MSIDLYAILLSDLGLGRITSELLRMDYQLSNFSKQGPLTNCALDLPCLMLNLNHDEDRSEDQALNDFIDICKEFGISYIFAVAVESGSDASWGEGYLVPGMVPVDPKQDQKSTRVDRILGEDPTE